MSSSADRQGQEEGARAQVQHEPASLYPPYSPSSVVSSASPSEAHSTFDAQQKRTSIYRPLLSEFKRRETIWSSSEKDAEAGAGSPPAANGARRLVAGGVSASSSGIDPDTLHHLHDGEGNYIRPTSVIHDGTHVHTRASASMQLEYALPACGMLAIFAFSLG